MGEFRRIRESLPEIREAVGELGLDGWLLYDLHARNGVAARLLEVGDLTRRYFVWLPAAGEPVALVHGIELAPWAAWPWRQVTYVGWRELEAGLRAVLAGARRVAMEVSTLDAVPALDLVPAGVVELARSAGAEVVSSADLVTRFHSRWTADGLASHRRAASVLARVAASAFDAVAEHLARGEEPMEGWLRERVLAELAGSGLKVGADAIAAAGPNSANPHYFPEGAGAPIRPGDVLLLDLWGKESEAAVYADQTWMAFAGSAAPERVVSVWAAVREARDAAVEALRRAWREGRTLQGFEVDDVARGTLARHGLAAAFIHRTGHSIDVDLHGTGPNIDNLETRETRRLIPGIGFSIEPGAYLAGEFGVRSEIDVYMGESGPEVTTPDRQMSIRLLGGV